MLLRPDVLHRMDGGQPRDPPDDLELLLQQQPGEKSRSVGVARPGRVLDPSSRRSRYSRALSVAPQFRAMFAVGNNHRFAPFGDRVRAKAGLALEHCELVVVA